MRAGLPEHFPRGRLIEDLARRLARHPEIERVWLFGSRARGDCFERSDIDLAVEAPTMHHHDWLKIKLEFEDAAPTLLLIDLMRWEEAPEDLRGRFATRGS